MNTICDIYIYCNNPEIESDIVKYYQKFDQKNKYLLITSLNSGYRIGGVEAVSKGIEMGIFKDYHYVIHLHPDVFITEDAKLMEILTENANNCSFCFGLSLQAALKYQIRMEKNCSF